MTISGILETILYADDLDAAEGFYSGLLGLEKIARAGRRHVFFKCGDQVLLVFDPAETMKPPAPGALPVPPHGAVGPGHICFKASAEEIGDWRERLERKASPSRRISNGRKAGARFTSAIRPETALSLPSHASGALAETDVDAKLAPRRPVIRRRRTPAALRSRPP